jgi:hypothetical protein
MRGGTQPANVVSNQGKESRLTAVGGEGRYQTQGFLTSIAIAAPARGLAVDRREIDLVQ